MIRRKHRIDRSTALYSEDDFLRFSREDQVAYAEKYWLGPPAKYDDGTFQFSRSQFVKLCKSIGLRKGIIDTRCN